MNWPNGMNYGHSNWTGVMPRTSSHGDSRWMYVERPARARPKAIALAIAAIVLTTVALQWI